jgi:hypothetical protein
MSGVSVSMMSPSKSKISARITRPTSQTKAGAVKQQRVGRRSSALLKKMAGPFSGTDSLD